jgi:hypothetical protein
MPTNRPPEAKEQSQQNHGHAQQYQHHAVAVPAPRSSKWRGHRQVAGLRRSSMFRRTCWGHEVAWGSDTGGQHE